MGKVDTITKQYMKDNQVFADAFNYLIYGGRQIIQPEKLHPLDTAAVDVSYGADGAEMPDDEVVDMCREITEMRSEERAEGALAKAKETALNLYEMGMKPEVIAKAVNVSLELVRGWIKSVS